MSAAYPKCLYPNAAKVLIIVETPQMMQYGAEFYSFFSTCSIEILQHHLIRLWRLHDTERLETQGACLLLAQDSINVKAAAQKTDLSVSSITA